MEPDEEKKLNDDVVVFMSKRSEHEAPRYTARLKNYVDFKQKCRRAAAARRHLRDNKGSANKKYDVEQKENYSDNNDQQNIDDDRTSRKRGAVTQKCIHHSRSMSRDVSPSPSDRCGRRRRRRRRRRSCGRRRRRRRSCRRRRRRCRSRRRRRRSCCRRRRRRRRRRC